MADEPATKPADAADAAVAPADGTTQTPAKPVTGKPTMAIKVFAPFKVFYEGEGYSLSAINETGPFDILPKHHNFLCMLVPCDLVIRTPYETRTIKISRALMHVKAEKVTIYLDV